MAKKSILLGVAVCVAACLAGAATTNKKKALRKRTHTVSAPASTVAKTTTARSRRVATKKTVRKASAPRQLAPTKERYQQIQQALASKGYYSGEPNGTWGPDSVEALKRFQADQNLTPDGKLGSLSLIALGLGPKRLSAQSAAQPAHADPQQ